VIVAPVTETVLTLVVPPTAPVKVTVPVPAFTVSVRAVVSPFKVELKVILPFALVKLTDAVIVTALLNKIPVPLVAETVTFAATLAAPFTVRLKGAFVAPTAPPSVTVVVPVSVKAVLATPSVLMAAIDTDPELVTRLSVADLSVVAPDTVILPPAETLAAIARVESSVTLVPALIAALSVVAPVT
jgi:hypothetical protein